MKKVRIRYTEKHTHYKFDRNTEYRTIASVDEGEKYHYFEFTENFKENDYYLKYKAWYNNEGINVCRISDDGAIHNEMYFPVDGKSIGFYEMKYKPKLSSNLTGKLLEYSFDNKEVTFNYDLYVEGIYVGRYYTTIFFEEVI